MDDPHNRHALAAARLALAYHGLDIPAMKTAIRELCDADNHLRMTGHVPPVTGITAWDEHEQGGSHGLEAPMPTAR